LRQFGLRSVNPLGHISQRTSLSSKSIRYSAQFNRPTVASPLSRFNSTAVAQRKQDKEEINPNEASDGTPVRELLKSTKKKPEWKKRREQAVREVYNNEEAADRLTRRPVSSENLSECTAYYTAEAYDIHALYKEFSQDNSGVSIQATDTNSAVVVRPHLGGNIYYFQGGCVVCWGIDMSDGKNMDILQGVKKYETKPVGEIQNETMDYGYTSSQSYIRDDVIFLESHSDQERCRLEQMAFSYGLHQSVRLASLEDKIAAQIRGAKDIQERLVEKRRWLTDTKTSKTVNRMLSNLLSIRASLNLHSDLLGTPELFWDHPELEKYFSQIRKNLEISPRISVVNKRLDESGLVLDLLKTELSTNHSARLEVLIIWLITIEVVLAITPYLR